MSCNDFPKIPNPVPVCQKIYGIMNVNDVRDATVNSLRRFYGWMCNINNNDIYNTIQTYMIKILVDAGRNPKAVRLSLPPEVLESSIFPKYYIQNNYNKDIALKLSLQEINSFNCSPALSQKNTLNCYIDYYSV
jgi:hypothetical protein